MEYTKEWIDEQVKIAMGKRERGEKRVKGEFPTVGRLYFGDAEAGWSVDLDEDTAIILNTPLEDDLGLYDVVRVVQEELRGHPGQTRRRAGEVLFQYWSEKSFINYKGDDIEAAWARIRDGLKGAGLSPEGGVEGLCAVMHNGGDDITEILLDAEVPADSFTVRDAKE